jgi:beta-galactosidase
MNLSDANDRSRRFGPLREQITLDGAWTCCACASQDAPTEVLPGLAWEMLPPQAPPLPGPGLLRHQLNLRPPDGKRAWVHFAATGGETVFFLNGKRIYASRECLLPVEFDISDHTDRLDNELIVWHNPRTALGAWPPVQLVYAPPISIPDAAVRTWLRRKLLEVEVSLENRTLADVQAELSLEVMQGEAALKEIALQGVELRAGVMTTLRFSSRWPDARLWSPRDPHLYQLKACLRRGGQTLDQRSTRFGFREVWQERGAWRLNGQALETIRIAQLDAVPADPRAYFQQLRASGVDLLSLGGLPPSPQALEAADETGLLMVGAYTSGLDAQQRSDHLTALLRRDRSHPSLLAWQASASREEQALFLNLDPGRPLLGPAQNWPTK